MSGAYSAEDYEFCLGTGYSHTLNSFTFGDECGDCGMSLKQYFSWWAGQVETETGSEEDDSQTTVSRLIRSVNRKGARRCGVERQFG